MGKFSKEWFFLECNLNHHCVNVELTKAIHINGKTFNNICVLELVPEDNEEKVILSNIFNKIDTNNCTITVKCFVDGESPHNAHIIKCNLNDIVDVEKYDMFS